MEDINFVMKGNLTKSVTTQNTMSLLLDQPSYLCLLVQQTYL